MMRHTNLVFPNCMRDITQATPIFHNNSYCIIFLDSPLKNIHFRKTVWFFFCFFFLYLNSLCHKMEQLQSLCIFKSVLSHFTVLSLFRLQEHYLLYPLLQYN